jgi:anaphase-promoting complex subunit 8
MVDMPNSRRTEKELRFAFDFLSANRLYESAKWVSELLAAMKNRKASSSSVSGSLIDSFIEEGGFKERNLENWEMEEDEDDYIDPKTFCSDIFDYPINKDDPFEYTFYEKKTRINDTVNLARVLFDLREYRKAWHKLKPYLQSHHQTVMFLYYYSLFMLSEQQIEEEKFQSSDAVSRSNVTNNELITIENELSEFYEKNQLNALNLFMYGTVLKKRNKKRKAREVFVKALNKFPLLWGAWLELNIMLTKEDQGLVKELIEDHWVKNFYLSSYFIQIQQEDDSITVNGALKRYFPDSVYILNQIGHACYLNQSFTVALDIFKRLLSLDPYRYESMDLYSNILYIQENYGELAFLAYRTFKWDKYRPETCWVLGNYYSLRGDHEKAVLYFKRALKLDSNFLSAWTLMGHEYLELKSTSAAIEAYRTAVDIDPSDFRAWYGLGQTYEIHQLYGYASYYFANAALSRPQDSRMWSAMGEWYQNIKKTRDATKCFEKAEKFKDTEGIALFKLAKLYSSMDEKQKAAAWFEEDLKRRDQERNEGKETIEACLYLATFYMEKKNSAKAIQYAERLMESHGPERSQAKEIIDRLK